MRREKMKQWFTALQDERGAKCDFPRSANNLHNAMIDDCQKLSEMLLFSTEEDEVIKICADVANTAMTLACKIHEKSGRKDCLPLDVKGTSCSRNYDGC